MKNIVKIYLLLIMIASFAMVSCVKEEQDQYTGGLGGYVPIGDMTIHPLGDEFKVHFTSNSSWKIDHPSWVTVSNSNSDSKTSGAAGTFDLKFVIEACYKGSDDVRDGKRSRSIEFQNTDTKETIQKFEIEQKVASINVDIPESEEDSSISFGWQKNDNDQEISIDSSVEYTITIDNNADFAIETETEGAQELTDDNGEVKGYFVNLERAKDKPHFTITPKNYNFSSEDNTANISVTPVKSNPKGDGYTDRSDVDEDLPKSLSVSQDFLIYKVFKGSINDSINDLEAKLKENGEEVVLEEISELGHTYLNSNQSADDNNLAVRKIVIVAESGVGYEPDAADYGCNFVKGGEEEVEVAGRKVKLTEYDVQVLKPNPNGNNPNDIDIPIPIKGYENEDDIPRLSVKLKQKPYVFQLEDANDNSEASVKVFENEGSSEMKYYTLKTSGPWEISNYNEDWLISDIVFVDDKKSGEGDFTFGLKPDGRNMSFADDNFAELIFSSGNFGGDLSTPYNSKFTVSQEKFKFDIKYGNQTDLTLTSSDTKEKNMSITSSGSWVLQVIDNSGDDSEWLNILDLNRNDNGVFAGEATTGEATTAKGFKIKATANTGEEDRDKILKLISTLHRDAGYNEKEYTKEFIVKQDKLHCAILKEKDGPTFSGCDMLAYDSNGLKQQFYLDCSVPWTVKGSLPDWIELWAQSDDGDEYQITSGDGTKYLTITAKIDANGETYSRGETVVLQADIDGDGKDNRELSFTVEQDGFVFKQISGESSYTFEAINNTKKEFSFEVTKGAFKGIDQKDWIGLIQTSKKDSENNKTEKFIYTVKPVYNVGGDATVGVPRNTTVIISNHVNDTTIPISIEQEKFDFALDKTSLNDFNELLTRASVDKQTIKVVGVDYEHVEVEYDEVKDWLEVDQNEYSAEKWSFKPESNNLEKKAREGKIHFIVKRDLVDNQDIVLESIPVKQNGYVWDVPDVNTDVKAVGEKKEISITSSGKWKIETEAKNVTISPNSGNGGNGGKPATPTPTITFPKHYEEDSNDVIVKVICEDNNAYNKELTFIQSGYEFNVTCGGEEAESEYSVGYDEKTLVFDVACSNPDDWNYEPSYKAGSEGMIEFDKNKTNTKLTVTVSSNKGDGKKATNPRECYIEIFLKDGQKKVRTKKITIKQEGYDPKKK